MDGAREAPREQPIRQERIFAKAVVRYGHLMPGNEREAAGLLDAYLDAAIAGTAVRS